MSSKVSKRKDNRKNSKLENVLLATAVVNLLSAIINLILKLMN